MLDGGYDPEFRAAAAIVLWASVVFGLALGFWPRAAIPRTALLTGMCLAGLAALTALSIAWASDDGRAFEEVIRVLSYLGLFVAVVLGSPSGGARPWLAGLALGLLAIAVLALGSRFLPALFPEDEIVAAIPGSKARLNYPIGYWNGLGACMALAVLLLAWLGSAARGRWARALATAAIGLPAFALALAFSRGASLALAIGVVVLVAASPSRARMVGVLALGAASAFTLMLASAPFPDVVKPPLPEAPEGQGLALFGLAVLVVAAFTALGLRLDSRLQSLTFSWRPSRAVRRAAIGAAAALALVVLAAVDPLERLDRFTDPPAGPNAGASLLRGDSSGRYQYWEAAVDAFASQPVAGIGAGGYEAWWGEHASLPVFIRDAHSLFAETLGELGIPGLLLIIGFLALAVATALRGGRRGPRSAERGVALALLAAGVTVAAVDWMWELPAVFAPVVLAAALLTGPALGPAPDRPRGRFGLGVATLLVAWIAILAAAVSLASEVKLDESEAALERGDADEALADASDARTLQPWMAEPHFLSAKAEELRGDIPAATDALDEAIDRAPDDWRLWTVKARLDAASGDLRGSLNATNRSNALRPEVPPPPEEGDS